MIKVRTFHKFIYPMFLKQASNPNDITEDEDLLFFLNDYAIGDFRLYVQDLIRIRNEAYGRKYAKYQRTPSVARPTFKRGSKV
jgi:hypothetical protein